MMVADCLAKLMKDDFLMNVLHTNRWNSAQTDAAREIKQRKNDHGKIRKAERQAGDFEDFNPISNASKRAAIAACYFFDHDSPPKKEWHGKDGTILSICRALPFGGTGARCAVHW